MSALHQFGTWVENGDPNSAKLSKYTSGQIQDGGWHPYWKLEFWHFWASSSKMLSWWQLLELATAGLHVIGHRCSSVDCAGTYTPLIEFCLRYVETYYIVFDM